VVPTEQPELMKAWEFDESMRIDQRRVAVGSGFYALAHVTRRYFDNDASRFPVS